MTRRTRLIILFLCFLCFIVVAPILIFYSMGYRFDFEKMKVTATGGIYVRSFPVAEKITIDSKFSDKPALFSNSIFVQSLLPNSHSVLVQKEGYYDYSKTIPVQEKQVTKLENIILFKKDIKFGPVVDKTKNPFENKASVPPEIKNMVAYSLQNGNIFWLKNDGLMYKSDSNNLSAEPVKITLTPIKIKSGAQYKIILDGKNIFLNANEHLLYLDSATNDLENFYSPSKDAKVSPDGKYILYFDEDNLYLSPTTSTPFVKNTLYKSLEKINDCLWLNDNYIILATANKIIISEIDYRGNINQITLVQKSDKIYFDSQEGKIYVLTGKTLLSSDKITP